MCLEPKTLHGDRLIPQAQDLKVWRQKAHMAIGLPKQFWKCQKEGSACQRTWRSICISSLRNNAVN